MQTKILGMETPQSYSYKKIEEWVNNCGLPNKHFIDEDSLYNMVMKCVKHGQKFSNHLRKTKKQ